MRYALIRPIHSSWMICTAGLSIVLGVVLASIWNLSWIVTLGWLLTGLFLCVYAIVRQRIWALPLVVIGGFIIGLWRGGSETTILAAYESLQNQTVELSGVLADDPDTNKQGNVVVRLINISWKGHNMPGRLWVSLASSPSLERSDHLAIRGKLSEGFGTFAAAMYHASTIRTTRPQPGDVALHVRNWFSGLVRSVLPEPEASLGLGFLVGERRALPDNVDTALKTAGLTHIIVASGYNLTILVRLARRLFEKVSKYLTALVSSGLIVGFIAVTGASPSMSRAGLVSGLSLLAWYYGRKFHPVIILSIALVTTVLINPEYAWGDVGWQLSFAAFAGVMLVAPLLQAYFFGKKEPGIIRQVLGETLAAWLCTLPILLFAFGYISNVAIFANLLILPLIPIAMLLTFVTGIGAMTLPVIAHAAGQLATWLLHYMISVAMWCGNLSWAKSEVTIGVVGVLLIYAGITGLTLYMKRATKFQWGNVNIAE